MDELSRQKHGLWEEAQKPCPRNHHLFVKYLEQVIFIQLLNNVFFEQILIECVVYDMHLY